VVRFQESGSVVKGNHFNVLVCIVNYRTDEALCEFVRSLAQAWKVASRTIGLRVLVVDNSGKTAEEACILAIRLRQSHSDTDVLLPESNVGYFGALPFAQSKVEQDCDYVVYSNADLVVDPGFFVELRACGRRGAVLAPSILVRTASGERDQNPAYEVRPSRLRLMCLRAIYSRAWMFSAYRVLWGLLAIVRAFAGPRALPGTRTSRLIYAPHGAMFIFADINFFLSLKDFKPFLFGEEIFVAEEARRTGADTVYVPNVRVWHSRHVSMKLVPQERQRRFLLEALSFLLERYYSGSTSK
jgi:GT2 family glycosyltransferase